MLQVITEKWSRSGTLVWHEERQRPALKVPTWFTAVHIAPELQTTQNSQNQLIHVKTPDKFEASHACGMDAGRYTIQGEEQVIPHSWGFCRFCHGHEYVKFHILPMSAANCVTEH